MSRQQSFPDDIWSTEPFASCSANAKYLYRWSRGNSSCGMAGIYRFRPRQAVLDTSLTSAMIERALAELRERGMVYVVDGVLWNVERVADLYTKTRQIAVSIAKDVKALPDDHPLRLVFLAYYAERRCGFPRGVLQEVLVEKIGAESIPASIEAVAIPALVTAAVPVDLPSAAIAPSKSEAREVFDAWSEATGKTGQTVFEGDREKLIRRWLGTYPKDDLIDAVRGWRHSPHHRGENDQRTIYNDLGLLLRNPANIERFRDLERRVRSGGDRPLTEADIRRLTAEAA